ncbi:MAG: hypothetical protein ACLGIB_07600 [Actinomycetota bacterium]
MKRILSLLAAAVLVAGAFAPTAARTAEPEGCGLTTLDATIRFGADGTLECGPGQDIVVREEIIAANPDRTASRRSLVSFGAIADVQLADEESPLRGEWADKCPPESPVSNSAFRPQETFVPHLLNAHIRALNAIAAAGSPVLDDDLDLVIGLGDLADNQQLNEIRWIIDLFDGNKIVDPDTGNDPVLGGDGYDGVQASDPEGSGVPLPPAGEGGPPVNDALNPLDEMTLLDLANEPFWATGLRSTNGQIPWYSLPGNHDVKVQGTIPDDNAAWRHAVRRYAIGHVKVMDLAPDHQARLCQAVMERDQVAFQDLMMEIVENPHRAGITKAVPSDPARLPLYRSDEEKRPGDEEACLAATLLEECRSSWIEEHFNTTGLPVGHGYEKSNRCTDAEGNLLERACYAFDHGIFRFIGLDTNPAEGLESGNIDTAQFDWLQRELRANSSRYYNSEGELVLNPDGEDKLIIVFTHHTISSTRNEGTLAAPEEYGAPKGAPHSDAATGEELKDLLLHHPNVILQASGHTHRNKVWAHENEELGTGYWEINTSAIADAPHQSRTIEIADNGDGTLSIFGVVFDAAADPDARDIHWTEDDPTDEAALAAAHGHPHDNANVNESWLASFGREVGFYDPQSDLTKLGSPADRNVELIIPAPFSLAPDEPDPTTLLTYTGDRSGRVGKTATYSAALTDASGAPLAGMTVTFERAGEVLTALTDASGVASVTAKLTGPRGTSTLTVSFAGAGGYLPSAIQVPFEVTGGPKGV